ncbi:MAG TPA: malto-oligosyltrehalose synthase, partial [Kiloniellales bacterium]|nr:malto-oligosyltrehalose synthase [Kiloniellales bacterium]
MKGFRALYRLQFRAGMDFDRAAALAPYLAKLGVSHLYASPLFQARSRSTHGYDVTDHGRIDESLGGMDGFLRLSAALRQAGLGLVLDIVPNHMAASPENPWWRDVLRHGRHSRFAGHFDIDWQAPKLLLPILGQTFASALAAREFTLGRDPDGLSWRYFDHSVPIDPRTWALVLSPEEIALPASDPAAMPETFAAWAADAGNAERLDAALEAASENTALLQDLHAAQPWRLAYWRAARDASTYRRFFELSDLVGVRVEEPGVFDDVHRLLFELLEDGHVQGLRIDHIDGLADPAWYLSRLAAEAPGSPPIWVEKILGPDEILPADWRVCGTTGYDFVHSVAALMIDPAAETVIGRAYDSFIGIAADPVAMLREAKRRMLTWNLAAELDGVTELAVSAAREDSRACDWGRDTLRRAVVALATAMPVYRSYLRGTEAPSLEDAARLARVGQDAAGEAELEDPAAVGDLLRLILTAPSPAAVRLRLRFQQTTGALMAKAMEDTLFYRYGRLLAANEVGGDPALLGMTEKVFFEALSRRAAGQPQAVNATATHDTKRGEDARLRIAAIADAPEAWRAAVDAWEAMLQPGEPEPEMRWHFYQALLGAWDPDDAALADRLVAYMIKAAREAKVRTSWTHINSSYEGVLRGFVRRALGEGSAFPADFARRAEPFLAAGARKSLVQLALKLTLPGIPDIYQGTEWADLSLVDPDNRRPVDFAARIAALETSSASGQSFNDRKLLLMRQLLGLRRELPELFAGGGWTRLEPISVAGARLFGFLRSHGSTAIAVLCELSFTDRVKGYRPAFALPQHRRAFRITRAVAGESVQYDGTTLAPVELFARWPV